MKAHAVLIMSAALGLMPSAATAQPDPRMNEPLPAEVLAQINDDVGMCTSMGGRVAGIEDYVRFADFNGDTRTDYLLVGSALTCSTAATLYCGQLGCPVTAYVSQPNGRYASGLDLTAFDVSIARVGAHDIVEVTGQTLRGGGLVEARSRWSYDNGRWSIAR